MSEIKAAVAEKLATPSLAPLNESFVEARRATAREFIRDCAYLTKPRLSSLVLMSTAAGFILGNGGSIDYTLLLHTLCGTALVAFGSSMLNQVLERKSDRLMKRTQERPLATGRMDAGSVLYAGTALSVIGLLQLARCVNLDAALWAAVTLALYVFVYTPLKRVTTLNTLVGAIPGALPPLIGWSAAQTDGMGLNMQAWSLFMIIFIWQLPHFLAIAWIYREDYARAGLQMWPTLDPDGVVTGRQALVQSVLLLPVSLVPYYTHLSGPVYFAGAAMLSFAFLGFGAYFAVRRTDRSARLLFLASVVYLPVLLGLMMATQIRGA
jgi:protoheme IX farnesyltransferase